MDQRALLFLFFIPSGFASCPPGATLDSRFNKCYQYFSQAASYLVAEKSCESLGGSLVSISNAFENSYISGLAASGQFWIGINLLYFNGWTWINGDNSPYRNWATSQPSASTPCGALQSSSGQWESEYCYNSMPYMCQIDPDTSPAAGCTTTPVPTNPPGSCPAGHCANYDYKLNPDTCKCYKWLSRVAHYDDILQTCIDDNATLPIILSQADNDYLAQSYKGYKIWLGLSCADSTTASCTWQDGTPLGYDNFYDGYHEANEYIYLEAWDGFWRSTTETLEAGVCQKAGIP